ncbi:Coiled-coil domain containing 12-like protein [Operophtera brumata]|uniref:Coiled-coil domain containing 12-like protein n=1 Tax=Operophtera brumata TaxID=104452 RepID=A0A0L7KVS9_OPEBR|nr:Coiled-coil domain containing 12-like protein [Operophtera brumata]
MDIPESIGSLEEQALKRKERLKNLKRKNPENSSSAANEIALLPKPKFRSYRPQDETLQEVKLDDAVPAELEEEVKDLLEAGKEKVKLLFNLAPRKPDWDLKRDVAKKLEKLERRTQKAIAELIWERLKHGNEDDLSAMVAMTHNRVGDEE